MCWKLTSCNFEYIAGAVIGAGFCLVLATKWGMPISGTHSVIGGVMGAGMAVHGTNSLNTCVV